MMDDQRIKLTDAEMVGRSRTLAQLIARLGQVKEEKKAEMARFKAEMEDLSKQIIEISSEINQGSRPADDEAGTQSAERMAQSDKAPPRRKYTLDPQKTMQKGVAP